VPLGLHFVPIINIATVNFHDPITDDGLRQVWLPSASCPLVGQYMGVVRAINGLVCELHNHVHHSGCCGCDSFDRWSRVQKVEGRCWPESR
jgi:hypothetical protein